jgi:tRNA(Ile)-lysidine synthase
MMPLEWDVHMHRFDAVHNTPPGRAMNPEQIRRIVAQTIFDHHMLADGDRVLIGVSGGIDSVTLLDILRHLASPWGLQLGLAHVNHGLRGLKAERDAAFVAKLAQALNLPLYVNTTGLQEASRRNLEETARNRRYAFLSETARHHGYNRIALGHHQDDEAELILMRILRGCGLRGLSGIPPVRPLMHTTTTIIRPLLRLDRVAIEAYAQSKRLTFVEDETNLDRQHLRNRVRHELLPTLQQVYNTNIKTGLSRMAGLLRDEQRWIESLVDAHLETAMRSTSPQQLRLDRQRLAQCHPALQRRLLRAAVRKVKGDLRRVQFNHIETARRLLADANPGGQVDLPCGLRIVVERAEVKIALAVAAAETKFRVAAAGFAYQVMAPGTLTIAETGTQLTFSVLPRTQGFEPRQAGQDTAYFDMDQLAFPLTIRSVRPGDRFTPFGLGGTQKVKQCLIDRKIPRAAKWRIPLIECGGTILWIAGLRRSAAAVVRAETTRLLKIERLVA